MAANSNILFALDDEQQQVLLGLTPADLDGGKADWALALAEGVLAASRFGAGAVIW